MNSPLQTLHFHPSLNRGFQLLLSKCLFVH